MPPSATSIAEVGATPLDIELTEPFGIATGAQEIAKNVLVRVRLAGGTVGVGEAAPFFAVNGETQKAALSAIDEARERLAGADVRRWRPLCEALADLPPSARCGIETAVFDALTRQAGLSLFSFFGGKERELTTDITIVTGSAESASRAARRAVTEGYRTLKVKVGGTAPEHDIARLSAICRAAPGARLVLDANAAMNEDEAVSLVQAVGADRIALFEQPTPPGDWTAMRRVAERARVEVAADESARTAGDVALAARERAAGVVNIKITKSGIVEALDMIAAAKALGLGLMIGGMVESVLAMTTSACLAAGIGGFRFVDLDTPLFMKNAPLTGGWLQKGPSIRVDHIEAGHGVRPLTGEGGHGS